MADTQAELQQSAATTAEVTAASSTLADPSQSAADEQAGASHPDAGQQLSAPAEQGQEQPAALLEMQSPQPEDTALREPAPTQASSYPQKGPWLAIRCELKLGS